MNKTNQSVLPEGFRPRIISLHRQLAVGVYLSSDSDAATIRMAVANYGILIQSVERKEFTFADFATVIEMHYDMAEPRNAEVVATLRRVHSDNERAQRIAGMIDKMERWEVVDLLDTHLGVSCVDDQDDEELARSLFLAAKRGKVPGLDGADPAVEPESVAKASAEEVIRGLLKVLHPGAVGLISNNHGVDRGDAACKAVRAAKEYLAQGSQTEYFTGYLSYEGIRISADFTAPSNASQAEKDAAFLAALAQTATVEYLCMGAETVTG